MTFCTVLTVVQRLKLYHRSHASLPPQQQLKALAKPKLCRQHGSPVASFLPLKAQSCIVTWDQLMGSTDIRGLPQQIRQAPL